MRKEKVFLVGHISEEDLEIPEVTCDSHTFKYNPTTETFRLAYENGVDEEGDTVTEVIIAKHAFVGLTIVLLPEETVTITVDEYSALKDTIEGLQETIDILSDPKVVADLKEAEADIEAGNTFPLDTQVITGVPTNDFTRAN